jgi:hypothetical protein
MPFQVGNKYGVHNRGGARPGAGRKPNAVRAAARDFSSPEKVTEWLEAVEAIARNGDSDRVRLAAYQELLNRALGKPRDPCDVTVTDDRSKYDGMTDEELIQACLNLGVPLPPGIVRRLEAAGKPIPTAAPTRIDHGEFARTFEHFTRTGEIGRLPPATPSPGLEQVVRGPAPRGTT